MKAKEMNYDNSKENRQKYLDKLKDFLGKSKLASPEDAKLLNDPDNDEEFGISYAGLFIIFHPEQERFELQRQIEWAQYGSILYGRETIGSYRRFTSAVRALLKAVVDYNVDYWEESETSTTYSTRL